MVGFSFTYPKWEQTGTEALITWDVFGYYLYLPAAFIHQDMAKLEFKDELMKKYRPASDFHHAFEGPTGKYVMKYPIGMSILYAPSFFIGCLLAKISGYPVDGFSKPFQIALSFGSMFVGMIGLWFSRKSLLKYFDDWSTGISLFLLVAATNYLENTAFAGAMAHNYLFTLYAILIYHTISWYEKPNWSSSLIAGTCIGLLTIARPTEIISVLIPIFWGIKNWSLMKERFQLWLQHKNKIIATAIIVFLIGCIQIMYWKIYTGQFLFYSYQDQGFEFLSPHIFNVLFSFRKGLFVYTPIMLFAAFGMLILFKKYRSLFWGILVFLSINLYIVSSWHFWWYGGSYGNRGLVQSYAIMLFPFAAFIGVVLKSKILRSITFILSGFFIWLNLMLTWQAHHNSILHPSDMTRAYYFRIFGKTQIEPHDRFLLDTQEDYHGKRKNVRTILFENFENYNDTIGIKNTIAFSGSKSAYINEKRQWSSKCFVDIQNKDIKEKWVRVSAKVYPDSKEWDIWKMTQMITRFEKDGQWVKNRFIRVHRLLTDKTWHEVQIDFTVPSGTYDRFLVEFWNASSNKELLIDDVRVEVYDED